MAFIRQAALRAILLRSLLNYYCLPRPHTPHPSFRNTVGGFICLFQDNSSFRLNSQYRVYIKPIQAPLSAITTVFSCLFQIVIKTPGRHCLYKEGISDRGGASKGGGGN